MFLISESRDLAIRGHLIRWESRHATEKIKFSIFGDFFTYEINFFYAHKARAVNVPDAENS